jgi:phosphoglycerate dehydrogenase-like enzyme
MSNPLERATALLQCGPHRSADAIRWSDAAMMLCQDCQGTEDVTEAAMRIFAAALRQAEQERDEARKILALEQREAGNRLTEVRKQKAVMLHQNDDLRAEVVRLKAICNDVPIAEADKPGITVAEAQDYV